MPAEMEDAFALLGFAPRPLIDEAALKERYLQLAAARHPDSSAGDDEKFHRLQVAYKKLREPASRLLHLAELGSHSERRKGTGPTPDAELFLAAGSAVHLARGVFERVEKSTSVLARALLCREIAAVLRDVRNASKSVQTAREELVKSLENFDRRWPEVSRDELSALASSFKFLSRWTTELSEWEFRLASIKA
ncbi:MAG TPA: J domain-containing protein [Terrimicrobiaceae bacterium]